MSQGSVIGTKEPGPVVHWTGLYKKVYKFNDRRKSEFNFYCRRFMYLGILKLSIESKMTTASDAISGPNHAVAKSNLKKEHKKS
jgi:hypothetical protein